MRNRTLLVSILILAAAPGLAGAGPCGGRSGSTAAKPLSAKLEGVRVSPSPWRSDRSPSSSVRFSSPTGLRWVMLFTTSGRWVRTLHCVCQEVETDWNLLNDVGEPVKSGIYLYLIRDVYGRQTSGTVAILR